jgi:signal transduction histidine kinase
MGLVRQVRAALWSVPVGLQLSVLYTLLFAATLALLGVVLYALVDRFLVGDTADRLENTTTALVQRAQFYGRGRDQFGGRGGFGGPPGQPFGGRGPGPDRDARNLVQALSGRDVTVALIAEDGGVITQTQALEVEDENARVLPLVPAEWLAEATDDRSVRGIQTGPDGGRELVLLQSFTLPPGSSFPGDHLYVEQVASLASADRVLNWLRLYLVLGIVVGTLIGVAAGMLLTRTVLRPLDRMVNTAEGIAGGDLGRRLRLPPGENEIARLGGAFDHMVDRLAAALEGQRRFIADASHELRTPLTSLEGLSELLLIGADRGDTGVVQRTVRSMHGELARLGRLVTDLLTLSRLDSAATVPLVCVDAARVVAEVGAQMAPLAESRQVRLQVEAPQPVQVRGEADRLKQVMINLTDNALRYTPPGGEVSLSAGTDPRTGQAQLRVQDTGPGIPAADLPHIFDRFYRGDVSRTRSTGNTGLGLAIAHAIVQAHGGTITVQSGPGAGACFTVALPSANGAC